jgi:dipeptidase E
MKLLLTSNGLSTPPIADALEELVGKPRKETKIAFVPTAGFAGDDKQHHEKAWLINDLNRAKEFAGSIDIVSLADLSEEDVLKRLEEADIIFVGGGNTFYLSYWMGRLGLFDALPELLKTRVYVGISAGSMVATQSIRTASQAINDPDKYHTKQYDELGPRGRSAGRAAKLVDFVVRPHLNSRIFPDKTGDGLQAIATELKLPLYAIDDNCAVKVADDQIEVVGGGEWKLYGDE